MRALRAFLFRLGGLFNKPRKDRELAEELEAHLRMQIEDNLRSGMKLEQARRDALLKSGGLELAKEVCRDRRGLPVVETVARDLRYAARMLRRGPAHTLVAVLSLALGIGATTAIFSVQKALLLTPLPYPEPDRLMVVWQRPPEERWREPLSSPDYFDYRERNRSFEELGVQALRWANLSGEGTPERVRASICTASFLRAVGTAPAMGRLFTDQEEADGERVVLLSHGLWKRRFGASRDIVGRNISVNREPHTVLGVMPAGYESPRVWSADSSAELWLPVKLSRADRERDSHWLAALGRLKRGVSQKTAEEDIRGIAAALAKQYPIASARVTTWMLPLKVSMTGEVRKPLWFLLAAVAVLLLISCANVASIQFARSGARVSEVAIRASLGAGRARVILQFLTENLVLAGVGGVGGVLLAWWGVAALRGMAPATIERAAQIRIDGWVLMFSIALTLATGLLSGLAPALSASRVDINGALREGQGTLTAGRRRARLQNALMAAQFALALVLANGALLMIQSYLKVAGTSVAFDAERTLAVGITLEGSAYQGNSRAQAGFWNRLLEQIRAIPGVREAGATTKLPLEGGNNSSFLVEGETYDAKASRPVVERSWIVPEYFAAAGIPLLAGRLFTPVAATERQSEILVNRAFARQYWREGSALGQRVYPNGPVRDWVGVVVGVVEDVPQWGLETRPLPEVYLPFELTSRTTRHLIIRAAVPPLTLTRAVRQAVSSIDAAQPIAGIRTLEQVIDGATARRRFNTVLVQIFALLALVMVSAGIHGVISCYVAQRAREVGIRMALGADRWRIIQMVVGRGVAISVLGILIGLGGFLALSETIASMLYGISPTNPASVAGGAFLLLLIALSGSALPALRAASIDPARTLRAI
jgi:predicted permease